MTLELREDSTFRFSLTFPDFLSSFSQEHMSPCFTALSLPLSLSPSLSLSNMESLQSPLVLSSKLLPNSLKKPVLEVGFACFFKQRVIQSVSIKRSVVCCSRKGGGGGSQDGSSAMLVNTEKKDASDSVGFHLVPPPSGMCILNLKRQFLFLAFFEFAFTPLHLGLCSFAFF